MEEMEAVKKKIEKSVKKADKLRIKGEFKESLNLLNKTEEKAKFLSGDKSLMGLIRHYQGRVLQAMEKYNEALEKLEEAIRLRKEDPIQLAFSVFQKYICADYAGISISEGKIEKTKMVLLELILATQNVKELGIGFQNLAYIEEKAGKITKAIWFYKITEVLRREADDKRGLAMTWARLGECYKKINEKDKVREYGKKALAYFEKVGDIERIQQIGKNVFGIDPKEVLKEGDRLYKEGKWDESINFLRENSKFLKKDNDIAELYKTMAWNRYYKGIKGPENEKMKNLEKAEECFELSLVGTEKDKTKISVLNGLPLTLWILKKKQEAWEISDKAIDKFPKTLSIWNTRGILCRWAKDFEKSIEVCEKTYETAMAEKDFRTAGHAKHNKGDSLVNLEKTEKAKEEYKKAIKTYRKYEKETGESASFHLKRVQEKLSSL